MNRPPGLPILRRLHRESPPQPFLPVNAAPLPAVPARLLPPETDLPAATIIASMPVQPMLEPQPAAVIIPPAPTPVLPEPVTSQPPTTPDLPVSTEPEESSGFDEDTWSRLQAIYTRHEQAAVQRAPETETRTPQPIPPPQTEPLAKSSPPAQAEPADELPTQPLPLESAWPVQRASEPGKPAVSPQPEPALTVQVPSPGAEVNRARDILQTISPAQPTDSHIEIIHPRTPRPTPSPRPAPPPPTTPSVDSLPTVQREPDGSPATVNTPAGLLPADLWHLIGEAPPVQRSSQVEQVAQPTETRRRPETAQASARPSTANQPQPKPPAIPPAAAAEQQETTAAAETPPPAQAATPQPRPFSEVSSEESPAPAAEQEATSSTTAARPAELPARRQNPQPATQNVAPPSQAEQQEAPPSTTAEPSPLQEPSPQPAAAPVEQQAAPAPQPVAAATTNTGDTNTNAQSVRSEQTRVIRAKPTPPAAEQSSPQLPTPQEPAAQPSPVSQSQAEQQETTQTNVQPKPRPFSEVPLQDQPAPPEQQKTAATTPPTQEQAAQARPTPSSSSSSSSTTAPSAAEQQETAATAPTNTESQPNASSSQAQAGPSAQDSESQAQPSEAPAPPSGEQQSPAGRIDTDELARRVYAQLRRRLAVEWERLRGRF